MRLTPQQRHHNETKIRAAIDRILRGDLPPGGKCDTTTLARESGIDRTAFYGNRPYAHLRRRVRNPAPTTMRSSSSADRVDRKHKYADCLPALPETAGSCS
jgi:hypothetical protein